MTNEELEKQIEDLKEEVKFLRELILNNVKVVPTPGTGGTPYNPYIGTPYNPYIQPRVWHTNGVQAVYWRIFNV